MSTDAEVDGGAHLSDLDVGLRDRVIASCREREPAATAILVHGSYATGRAVLQSDLDLDVFIDSEPTVHYRTWFETRAGSPPLHVSARCDLTLEAWEEEADEPEDWSLGLPVELPHEWLWRGDGSLVKELGERPTLAKPGGSPEIEDMVDALIKIRRRATAGGDLGLRLEAQVAARCAAQTVAAMNRVAPVSDPRGALEAAIGLPTSAPQWRTDLPTCLGLTQSSASEVHDSAERLVLGTLRLVIATNVEIDPQPEISRYLAEGTILRLLK